MTFILPYDICQRWNEGMETWQDYGTIRTADEIKEVIKLVGQDSFYRVIDGHNRTPEERGRDVLRFDFEVDAEGAHYKVIGLRCDRYERFQRIVNGKDRDVFSGETDEDLEDIIKTLFKHRGMNFVGKMPTQTGKVLLCFENSFR